MGLLLLVGLLRRYPVGSSAGTQITRKRHQPRCSLSGVVPARGLVIAVNSASPDATFTKESIAARIALFDVIREAVDSEPRGASAKP
jgi:hypothetical protein